MELVTDLFGNTQYDKLPGGAMCQRFGEPPFSVLDTKTGRWQERKRDWMSLGIESEIGREISGRNCTSGANSAMLKVQTGLRVDENGVVTVTSIFDPVLCELVYSWFYPQRTTHGALDPFAGGSVRGIVASRMGLQYTGIELRREQVESNLLQAIKIPCMPKPHWIVGDSREINSLVGSYYDLLFTCPPYWNLERYSDKPEDLSTLDFYDIFIEQYSKILTRSVSRLHGNRFAVVAIGNARDKNGIMRDLCGDTIRIMQAAGMHFYNDIVILTAIASLPLRANKPFAIARKVGNAHQRLLVFYKGNPDEIREHYSQFDGGSAREVLEFT